jgi:excisionase family DNA binding protein
MKASLESEQLQKALTELATAMTRIVGTRVDQAVTQIMSGKLPGEITGSLPVRPEARPTTNVEGFISKPEVAKRLGKTLRTVDNWMNRGLLPYYKIGRSVNFRWSEVQHHLAQTARVRRYY